MKALIIGLAALCLGTVGLASSTSGGFEHPQRLHAASPYTFGFPLIGTAGRWSGSPA